jgi:hypothetical protein
VIPVRYELNLYMLCSRPPLWSSGQSSTQRRYIVLPVRYELNLYMLYSRPPLWSSGHSSWLQNGDVL